MSAALYIPAEICVIGDERLNLRNPPYADEDEIGVFMNSRITLSKYFGILKHIVDFEKAHQAWFPEKTHQ